HVSVPIRTCMQLKHKNRISQIHVKRPSNCRYPLCLFFAAAADYIPSDPVHGCAGTRKLNFLQNFHQIPDAPCRSAHITITPSPFTFAHKSALQRVIGFPL
uniref:Uncharacterized protein n=1 Tax=Parascaris univalens TaxID=6257 RepID=A0A915B8S4_PARUN